MSLKEKDIVLAKDQQPFWTPLTFTPSELAQQLSLIEWTLLRRVEPREFLSRAWLQPTRDIRAPHLMKLIHRTNTVLASDASANDHNTGISLDY